MTIAIIPIGGHGIRMNTKIPKQFLKVDGKCIFMYTLEKFQENDKIDMIIIACVDGYSDFVKDECKKYNITKLRAIVPGGSNQLESIFNCYNYIKNDIKDDTKIMIHVGNRPLISQELINKCLVEYDNVGMLTTYVPSVEVMYNIKNKKLEERNNIIRIQTPQVYSSLDIKNLLNKKNIGVAKHSTIFDLMIENGFDVSQIPGELINFKITYPEDLLLFESLIKNRR